MDTGTVAVLCLPPQFNGVCVNNELKKNQSQTFPKSHLLSHSGRNLLSPHARQRSLVNTFSFVFEKCYIFFLSPYHSFSCFNLCMFSIYLKSSCSNSSISSHSWQTLVSKFLRVIPNPLKIHSSDWWLCFRKPSGIFRSLFKVKVWKYFLQVS